MYEIRDCSSYFGASLLGFELLLSSCVLHWFLKKTFNLHTAICLIIDLVAVITIFMLCVTSKIINFIISLVYSVLWGMGARMITATITDADTIWMLVIGGITFLISFLIHISLVWVLDDDFDFIFIRKY